MKTALVLVAAAILLTACDGEAKVFGRSYDECILRNANGGGDATSRATAADICARHFKRWPKKREQEPVGLKVTLVTPGNPTPDDDDRVEIIVENGNLNTVVTKVALEMEFFASDPWKEPGQKPLDKSNWILDSTTQPGEIELVMGHFGDDEPASRFGKVKNVEVVQVLPLKTD
jgi:hypothetical protein